MIIRLIIVFVILGAVLTVAAGLIWLERRLLALWQDSEATVVFITHSLDEAARLADRVLIMTPRPGRIKAEVGL